LTDIVGDAFVALGANAARPLDRGVGTDLALPVRDGLGEIVGEQEGRAGAVGAVDHEDWRRGQLRIRIALQYPGIVPRLDLAKENLRERRAIDQELAGFDAIEIDDRHYAAHHGRELGKAILVKFLTFEWHIARAEGDGLGLDLLDAAARANRLIVQSNAGLF